MEHQELKTKVGKKAGEIWAAYQEVLAELKGIEAGPQSTTAVSEAKRREHAMAMAAAADVDSWLNQLEDIGLGLKQAKEVFDDLDLAIEAKRAELKEVYDIEVEANSLLATIGAKDRLIEQREEDLRRLIEESERKSAEYVAAAKEEAARIDAESRENARRDEESRKRIAEDWDYTFKRNCRAKIDKVNDDLAKEQKEFNERLEVLVAREDRMDELQQKVDDLEATVAMKDREAEQLVAEAIEETRKKEAKSLAIQKSILENSYQSKIDVLEARNTFLTDQLEDMHHRLENSEARVMDANNKVTAIATGALQATGDRATIARVAEVAAGSKKQ